ncbi:50S ribosomal protein L22, partial [bacterium]|nr:50S ribosomal protein L22 [bacterium]
MAKQTTTEIASSAYLKMVTVSPVRCRQVADLVRGKSLEAAHRSLILEKVKSAKIVLNLLKSAMANAQQKGVADLDRLYISEIQVNEGPRIKRFMPRAQGRADVRLGRTSHIILKLSEKKVAKK